MDLTTILNKQVSFQATAWMQIEKEMTIRDVLMDISSEKYFKSINRLRSFLQEGEKDKYNIYKKQLPAVTFCGVFDKVRRKDQLKEYNQLMVLDVDKLEKDDIDRVKTCFNTDKYVFAYWESPSQNGIKGLVALEFDHTLDITKHRIDGFHKSAFNQLKNYYTSTYEIILDESGSDTTRLCFLSYDPDLILKSNCIPFFIDIDGAEFVKDSLSKLEPTNYKAPQKQGQKYLLYNSYGKNKPIHRKVIQAIIKYLTRNGLSITYDYDEWYRVAFAIANSFTYDIGLKYFISLSKLDPDKFDKIDSNNMLIYAYENSKGEIKFGTIVYLAKLKGYKSNKEG